MTFTFSPRHPKPAVGLVMQARRIGRSLFAVGGLGSGGFVLRSADDGKSWAATDWHRTVGAGAWSGSMPSDRQHGLRHIYGLEDRLVVVGEYGTVLESDDGAESFRKVENKRTGCTFGIAVRGDVLYVAGDDGILRKKLGAKTWKTIEPTRDLCRIWQVHDTLWVLGDHAALFRVGPDDDVTRVRVGIAGDYYGFCALGGERFVMVGTQGLVAVSEDGGVTWEQGHSGVKGRLMGVAKVGDRIVAVGQSGAVVSSSDGRRFTAEKSPGKVDLWGINTDDADPSTAWIAGDGGKIWRLRVA